jgi:anti-sigma B factor antagonist
MHWTDITERRYGDVVVLDLRGNMALSDSPGRLVTAINQLVQRGERNILLNLVEVPYLDSQGLADIVQGFKIAQRGGGTLKLIHIADRIRELLVTTKLTTFIQAFDSEQEAVDSFRSPRK